MFFQEPCKGPSERGSACLQCPVAEPCSSETTREADDASPVSVLKAPFTEDSSSESFERVSTELHELQKHLQLLKMESEAYARVPALFSNQEEVAQQSQLDSEENQILRAESWEVSYFLDVLIASGFEVADPDMLGESWYTPECPLHPAVFDNLEKKYSEETTVSRSERRLLFDRINSSLLEFLQQHVDSFTLVLPKIIGVSSKWETHRVEDAIRKLLTGQELLVNMDLSDRTLYREMQWLEFKDEIDVIGNEIEKLLIDDMILDVLAI
ncbi:hypothetical protein Fot_33012 [Forsythia ovata]|uniref:DUF4378 domain-containing protein n=1 Tax=Forsythia ovata TaxID=205694 RepID=A0ABD1T9K0_9LAMI